MATKSEPQDNLPLERTKDSMPEVLSGTEAEWALFDDDGNVLNV